MKVITCQTYGPPESLIVQQIDAPTPTASQVRVKVAAAGVNFVDALFVAGSYQVKIPPPFIPGNELAGVIDTLGSDVEGFSLGDRVMAQVGVGAFAEQVCVPAKALRLIPEAMSMEAAAAFQLTYATASMPCASAASCSPAKLYWCWPPRVAWAALPWTWRNDSAPG